jgi:cytosine/adenosine deaminase-related metal-dependent hydrolase
MNGQGANQPRGQTVLLRGGLIVSMDERVGDLRGDLLIAAGKIKEIAPRIEGDGFEVVDASGYVVLPGFIDSHRHTWQTPIRHMGVDWDLSRMFVELFVKFGPNFRPEDVYAATLFGRLAALDAGITTLLDWAHIQNTPDHADEAIRALNETGARTIFAHGQPGIDPQKWMAQSSEPHPSDIRRVRERVLPGDDGLVTMAMAARGPEFSTIETVAKDIRLARELGLRVTMHVGLGTNGPKWRSIARIHEHGLLASDLTFVHCCTSSDHEFHLLAETGATASVSPQIAMLSNGFGLPATGRLIEHGVRPSLSVDSEMTANGDMFSEMRAALGAERMIYHNTLEARARNDFMTARDVLSFATREGARTVGLEHRVGTLTPGKSADIILIDAGALNLAPMSDTVGALVMGGHAGNVEAVFVEGRPVKWNGRLVSADADRALAVLNRTREYLYEKAAAIAAQQGN